MLQMTRARWIALVVLLVAADLYLLIFRTSDVQGNIEASIIWGTPALVAQHLALRRHMDRRHDQTQTRLDEQDQAAAEAHRQIHELHRFHVHAELPPDALRPPADIDEL